MINFVESMNSQLFKHLFKHIRFLRVKVLEAPNPKYCENFVDSSNLYQAPDNICGWIRESHGLENLFPTFPRHRFSDCIEEAARNQLKQSQHISSLERY